MAATNDDLASLMVSVSADVTKYVKQMETLVGVTAKAMKAAETAVKASNDNQQASYQKTAKVAVDSFNKTGDAAQRSMRGARAEAANMSAQFQDIAVQLQSGTSPMTIAMQQGTQLASVLQNVQNQGGGLFKSLGAAALSFINPIQIGTIAVIALTGYLIKFASQAVTATKTADDVWKQHQQTITDVKEVYGDLVKGIDAIGAGASGARLTARLQGDITAQIAVLQKAQQDFQDTVGGAFSASGLRAAFGTGSAFRKSPVFAALKDFSDQMVAFKAGTADTAPDIDKLIENLQGIASTMSGPAQRAMLDFITRLGDTSTAADKAQRILTEMQGQLALVKAAMDGTTKSQETFNKALGDMSKIAVVQLSSLDQLISKYREAVAASQGMEDRVAAQAQLQQGLTRVHDEAIKSLGGVTDSYTKFVDMMEGSTNAFTKNPFSSAQGRYQFIASTWIEQINKLSLGIGKTREQILDMRKDPAILDKVFKSFTEDNVQRLRDLGVAATDVNTYLAHVLPGLAAKIIQAPRNTPITSIVDAEAVEKNKRVFVGVEATVGDVLDNLQRRWEKLNNTVEMTDLGTFKENLDEQTQSILDQASSVGELSDAIDVETYSREKAKLEAEAEAIIKKTNTELTKEESAALQESIDKRAIAAARSKDYQLSLKQESVELKDAARAQRELEQQFQQTVDQAAGMATGFVTGFISDLESGKSATEALTNALKNLADQLLSMALNKLFQALFSGIGTALGVPGAPAAYGGGRVGALGGTRSKLSPFAFVGAPRMATGGFVGVQPGEFPTILHRGEVVIPASMVRQSMGMGGFGASGGQPQKTTITIGNVSISAVTESTGDVKGDTAKGKALGRTILATVQAEMARQTRPGGLLTANGSGGRVGR